MHFNYNEIIKKLAEKYGSKTVKTFLDSDRCLSYEEIHEKSLRLANEFVRLDVKSGDRVAVWMGNNREYVIICAACLRVGAVFLPISIYEPLETICHGAEEYGFKLLFFDKTNKYVSRSLANGVFPDSFSAFDISDGKLFSALPEISSCLPINHRLGIDDDISLIFSSGSTGKKKCLRKSIRSYFGGKGFSKEFDLSLKLLSRIYPLRIYNVCPYYHNTGITLVYLCLFGGIYYEFTNDRFNTAKAARDLGDNKINIWLGTASMLYRCCKNSSDIALPDFIVSTGESLPNYMIKELTEHEGGKFLYSGYGTSETGPVAAALYRLNKRSAFMDLIVWVARKMKIFEEIISAKSISEDCEGVCLGNVCRSVNVRIFDESENAEVPQGSVGDIYVNTKSLMNGYLNRDSEKLFVEFDGVPYYRTGDMGFIKDKRLYLSGRKNNMIVRSGVNVFPSEIEQKAVAMKGVKDAVAFGIPDELYGESVCLFIEAEENGFDKEAFEKSLKTALPKYMHPSHVVVLDEFPLNHTGKKDVPKMRKQLMEDLKI